MATNINREDLVPQTSLPHEVRQLLALLEAANKEIEEDPKSFTLLSGMSRTSSASGASTGEHFWTLWERTLNNWNTYNTKESEELDFEVVPTHFRALAIVIISPHEKQIRRDIYRTFPDVEYFKDTEAQIVLFNVIQAYALSDTHIGHCQGTAFVTGLLLMQMPEGEAFAVTVQVMQTREMREIYRSPIYYTGLSLYQLDNLINDFAPDLYRHFCHQGVQGSMFASSWFLTIYTRVLSATLSCRIIDILLWSGPDIMFQVALALLTISKNELLKLDKDGMQMFFQKDMAGRADESLINMAKTFKIDSMKMNKYKQEYQFMKSKEHELEAEITLAEVLAEGQLLDNSDMNRIKRSSSEVLNGNSVGNIEDSGASQEALFTSESVDNLDEDCIDLDKTLTPEQN